jgi:hypothetical protein
MPESNQTLKPLTEIEALALMIVFGAIPKPDWSATHWVYKISRIIDPSALDNVISLHRLLFMGKQFTVERLSECLRRNWGRTQAAKIEAQMSS